MEQQPLTPSEEKELISEGQVDKVFDQERAELRRLLREGQLTTRVAQSVLGSGKLQGLIAAAILELAQTLTGLFRGLVNYDRPVANLIKACDFNRQYIGLPPEEWPVTRRGQHQVEVREDHLVGKIHTIAQIDARLADDEEYADPVAVLDIFGRQNLDRQRQYSILTFFKDADGQRWDLILVKDVYGGRVCHVCRVSPQSKFYPNCPVAVVRKSYADLDT